MSYISASVEFENDRRIRSLFPPGHIKQYLPFHFTILYGCEPFVPEMKTFMEQFQDPNHPIYTEKPKPLGMKIFHNERDGYKAIAVHYEWEAGKKANWEACNHPTIYPKGASSGFNGEKWQAHVTIAYIEDTFPDVELLLPKDLELFNCNVKNVCLYAKVKPV